MEMEAPRPFQMIHKKRGISAKMPQNGRIPRCSVNFWKCLQILTVFQSWISV